MGLRGPAPKPTALRVYEGNPSRRPLNDREPVALLGEPEMPKHLDRDARREWRRLVPLLLSMRVLSESDGIALGSLCITYSRLIQAQRLMAKSSLLIKTPGGYVMQSPVLSIVNSQLAALSLQLKEFGLTPSSRSRMIATSETSGGIDPLERALCGEDEDFEPGGAIWLAQQRKKQ
jgi:P27 family predicted phage terminase small subunit